ncbi:hypothetical protein HK405_013643, partial [Cladochytrium tenue]
RVVGPPLAPERVLRVRPVAVPAAAVQGVLEPGGGQVCETAGRQRGVHPAAHGLLLRRRVVGRQEERILPPQGLPRVRGRRRRAL